MQFARFVQGALGLKGLRSLKVFMVFWHMKFEGETIEYGVGTKHYSFEGNNNLKRIFKSLLNTIWYRIAFSSFERKDGT